ncbi:MAG: zinc-dependent alcohol dehydrogenase [Actinomycetota bacterium]
MRAARVVEANEIEITDVAEPDDPRLTTVRVQQVGICGTDTKIVAGKIPVQFPRILGHEMVGRVVSAPAGSPHQEGTRVLVDPALACGWCDLCLAGRPNLCRNGGLLGRDVDGVFTEYVTAPLERLVAVPETISDTAAGLLQVLGTCVHAVRSIKTFPGQVAAVVGLGVAGQLIAQLLTLEGLEVVGVTRSEWKRRLAADLGAVATAAPDEAETVLAGHTDGRGPDLVVEAAGTEATLARSIELVTIGGQILGYGTITGGGEGLPYYDLYHKELTLHNPRAALVGDYADGIHLTAAGKLTLEPIVTHRLDLSEAEEAFRLVEDSSSLKVLMNVA